MIRVKTIFIVLVYLTIASAFNLKCNFIIKKELYCCSAQNLDIDEPNTKISSVFGIHSPNLTNAEVHNFDITKQKVKFLPINIAEYFPNLKRLAVKFSKLKFITPNDLLGLSQLSTIYMPNNTIRDLPCGVFDNNQRLEEIHFENNYVATIGADIFEPLLHLKVVHFRNNNCINRDANETATVPGILSEIKNKCVVSCDKSTCNPGLDSSCDSKFDKKVLNETANTFDYICNATIIENDKLINENNELRVKLIELETKFFENINETQEVNNENYKLNQKLRDLETL